MAREGSSALIRLADIDNACKQLLYLKGRGFTIYARLSGVCSSIRAWMGEKVATLRARQEGSVGSGRPSWQAPTAKASDDDCCLDAGVVMAEFGREFGLTLAAAELYIAQLDEVMEDIRERQLRDVPSADEDKSDLSRASCAVLFSFFRVCRTILIKPSHKVR